MKWEGTFDYCYLIVYLNFDKISLELKNLSRVNTSKFSRSDRTDSLDQQTAYGTTETIPDED